MSNKKEEKKEKEMSGEFLTKEEIERVEDIKTEIVEVPEWGEGKKVRVRALSGMGRDEYDNILAAHTTGEPPNHKTDIKGMRAEICALCLVDEMGIRLFNDEAGVAILNSRSGAAINRIYEVACEISGLNAEARKLMRKNSDGAQSASSGTSSPDNSDAQL